MKKIQYKRKSQGKTNYKTRLSLLKSNKPRLIIRKSLKNTIVQIANYNEKGDVVIASAHTRELAKKYGWKYSRGNMPAAYLTGLLCGKKAEKANVKQAIVDIGLQKSIKGSKLYAALKGVLDAGIDIPHSDSILPKEERIKGEHIQKNKEELIKAFEDIKSKIIGR